MGRKILFNGQITGNLPPVPVTSETINYGKGFFETILYEAGRLFFYNEHLKRLDETCRFFDASPDFRSLDEMLIKEMIQANGDQNRCLRVKILCTPLTGGWDTIAYSAEYTRQTTPVAVAVHHEPRQRYLARFKSLNYFENLYWKNYYAGKLGTAEVLFQAPGGGLLEGSYTNLFCVKNDVLYSPAPGGDYLHGIMQQVIAGNYQKLGFKDLRYKEKGLTPGFLKKADEVFLTNSLLIARCVEKIVAGSRTFELRQEGGTERVMNYEW